MLTVGPLACVYGSVGTDQLWQYWASIVEIDVQFLLGVLRVTMLSYSNWLCWFLWFLKMTT